MVLENLYFIKDSLIIKHKPAVSMKFMLKSQSGLSLKNLASKPVSFYSILQILKCTTIFFFYEKKLNDVLSLTPILKL